MHDPYSSPSYENLKQNERMIEKYGTYHWKLIRITELVNYYKGNSVTHTQNN